ncbi:MAG: hypothetical protein IJZ19_07165 [Lentisphaeria bacterium]|nr:hypothetical protein [Lentisphaeria bacterium]
MKSIPLQTDSFRSLPFWAWNGKLCEEELRRQIRIFREMGYGGFFMHSRTGLNTDYLSSEWFDMVRVCIDEAKKQGIEAWLYDEDRYASGSGSGEIGKKKRFRRRTLELAVLDKPVYRKRDLAWFAGELCGTALFRCRQLKKGDSLKKGETFLRFYEQFVPADSWNNGGYYSDMMNAEAIREFIHITHDRYAEECGDDFGNAIPGIFSDEPNCSNWTEKMEEKFFQRYGENLLEHLPELFFEMEGKSCSKVRWQLENLRTELLVSAFAVQTAEWCKTHGLLFTGHVFGEESVITQTKHCGSAMRFIQHMDIPGIDLLSDHQLIYDAMLQTASVARQNGKKQVLCESFAGTGWDFPLYAQKACMDWQFALGITRFCIHLAFYTLQGEVKRDYPPSIHFQSPYYKLEKILQDHASRVGFYLGSGEAVCPILVIHPLESTWFWKPFRACSQEELENESRKLPRLRNVLLREKLAFDYGDEAIIDEHGKAENGTLYVRYAGYAAAVLPELRTIRKSTLRLLEKFADQGGRVFYLGTVPEFVDCERSQEAAEVYRKFTSTSFADLPEKLAFCRSVSLKDGNGKTVGSVLSREVICDEGRRLFLCNTGCPLPLGCNMSTKSADERTLTVPQAVVRWKGEKDFPLYEMDLLTGCRKRVNAVFADGWWEFETAFGQLEAKLFLAEKSGVEIPAEPLPLPGETVRMFSLPGGGWNVYPDEPNVLPLDFAEYSIAGGNPQYGHLREADSAARKYLGLPERSHEMIQPWKQKYLQDNARNVETVLRFRFECRNIPEELSLALEEAERYDILLNGQSVEVCDAGWWCDPALRLVRLPEEVLLNGENILELSCRYDGSMSGFEAIYLLGDFGVFEDELTAPVRTLSPGDWGLQGYPYYSGNMTYRIEFNWHGPTGIPVFPDVQKWQGTALGISLNGSPQQIALLAANRLNIGNDLKTGCNLLEITVYGSRRNSFGPFGADPGFLVDPSDFSYSFPTIRRLKPYGIMSEIRFCFNDTGNINQGGST